MEEKNDVFLEKLHIPRWSELPAVELYLDQAVTLINNTLSEYIHFSADNKEMPVLTKTMINNYVKNNLIDAPEKKKYGKIHIAKLFAVCILKQVYSMNDIKKLIDVALTYSDAEGTYNRFCSTFEEALKCTYLRKDFINEDAKSDSRYLLKSVLLSCSYKIYAQNMIYKKDVSK